MCVGMCEWVSGGGEVVRMRRWEGRLCVCMSLCV